MIAVLLFVLAQVPAIRDEGAHVCRAQYIDFVGAGVTATCPAGVATITVPTGTHNLLSATHPDTVAVSPPGEGSLIYANASGQWEILGSSLPGRFLKTVTGTLLPVPAWEIPDFADLDGTATDAQIPNSITVDLAATATALAANGTNCAAGNYPLGVDASGNAESCTAAGGGAAHNLLSATHGDTTAFSPPGEGDLIIGVGGAWEHLTVGAAGSFLKSFGVSGAAWTNAAFTDLSGSATDAQVPNTITIDLASAATALAANGANCAAGSYPLGVDASGAVEGCTAALASPVAIADGGTGQTTATAAFDALAPTTTSGDLIYHNGTDNVRLPKGTAYQILRTSPTSGYPEWGHSVVVLSGDVSVAASASYTTVFSTTPVASKANVIHYNILHTASATTVGVQFRVSSADAGNVGNCFFTAHGIASTAASATAEEYDVIAIGAAPADNGSAAAGFTALNLVEIWCQFTSDGTPGAVLLEAQLETGTTSINVLVGSYYTYLFN